MVGGSKIAIVGAGRMGSLLAGRLPRNTRKVIISRRRQSAVTVADEVGGIASDQLSAVRGCEAVFLTLPGQEIIAVLQEMLPHLDEGAVVVNMATDLLTEDLVDLFPRLRLVAAKVVGHAREIAAGSPAVVVLDRVSAELAAEFQELLHDLGHVVVDDEAKVLAVNTAVAEEMVRAEQALRRRLAGLGLDDEVIGVAIRTTGPGILRALGAGDAGPFLQDVMRRLAVAREQTPR